MAGWTRYLFHDYWTAKEFNSMEDRMRRQASTRRRRDGDRQAAVEELEAEIGFVALMNRAMLQVMMENGLCDKARIGQLMRHFDTLDGEADGGLDAAALAGDLGLVPEAPEAPKPAADAAKKLKGRRRKRK